ncbi:MAG TPA: NUDIX domain-containing protein [Terriglobales bacterium]|nr:NUDIX domain-containing protein [Terriglobales bacterium]
MKAATPSVAVDVVIFTIEEHTLKALLVRVKDGPFAGRWAFPGGRVPIGEPPEQTAGRELAAQTGIRDVYLEQLRTFGNPGRDPEAHVVSIAYFALVPEVAAASDLPLVPTVQRRGGDTKYAGARWAPVHQLPPLAYDHRQIARYARERLQAKLGYTNIAYSLLPRQFTLADLQNVYEVILGRQLDRRNFRKKLLAAGLLQPLAAQRRGNHRPAQLYRFLRRTPMRAEIL